MALQNQPDWNRLIGAFVAQHPSTARVNRG